MKKVRIFAATRSFQAKATFDKFDQAKFDKGLAASVHRLLSTRPDELAGVTIISCGDQTSPAREEVRDGLTPTMAAVKRAFPQELAAGIVQVVRCDDWGQNFGSATALNDGIGLGRSLGATHHFLWSAAEMQITGRELAEVIEHSHRFQLELSGPARNGWGEYRQWLFVQNTIALWSDQLLASIGDFDRRCNGDGVTVVETKEYGPVPLAGMEDYHAYLRACAHRGEAIPWGFVGTRRPVYWDVSAKLPGTEEYQRNNEKIARQGLVMDAWAKAIFPDRHPIEVWRDVLTAVKIA